MPLTPEERDWAQQKIDAGVPKDQVFEFLASRRPEVNIPAGSPAVNVPQVPGRSVQPDLAQTEENRQREIQRQLMKSGAALYGGMLLGPVAGNLAGGLAEGSALPRGVQMLARPAGEAAGQFAGTFGGMLGGQAATGQPLNVGEAASEATKNALLQGGLSLANVAAVPVLGKLGGVSTPAALAAAGRPGFAAKVPAAAEDTLARQMAKTFKYLPKTEGRANLESMIAAHDAAGKTIDGQDIVDAVRSQIKPNAVHSMNVAANKEVSALADRIEQRIVNSGSTNMSASDMDEMIRHEFTRQLSKSYKGVPGGNVITSRLKDVRESLQDLLYRNLGPGAAQSGMEANQALTAREKMQTYFPTDQFGDPRLQTPGRIAASGSPANRSGPTLLRKAEEFDSINGTKIKDSIVELGQRREWGPSAQRTANLISSALQIPQSAAANPSKLRDLFRMLGRAAVRSQGVTGAGIRGTGVAMTSAPNAMSAFSQAMNQKENK